MLLRYLQAYPRRALLWAAVTALVVTLADAFIFEDYNLGMLYMLAMLLAAPALAVWQLLGAALLFTVTSAYLDTLVFNWDVELVRNTSRFLALAGTGLFSRALTRSHTRETENLARAEEAERQLQFLIESSPAAIFTTDSEGRVVLANPAAHQMLGLKDGALTGNRIVQYLPALATIPSATTGGPTFRTEMQFRGQRASGDYFVANAFFSTYQTATGPRMAALVVDASEQLRDQEENNLNQLLSGSRILIATMSHEYRNVCAAIRVVHENLARDGGLAGNKDFAALGSLVETLSGIASLELKESTASEVTAIDLADVLADLQIVLEPVCSESEIVLQWDVPPKLPAVSADRHRLLQVLLNLTRNSERALKTAPCRRIEIGADTDERHVYLHVSDSGPGISDTTQLFQPLQKGAHDTGLGLYISRAFMRSFGGDLRHDPSKDGCSFIIELPLA